MVYAGLRQRRACCKVWESGWNCLEVCADQCHICAWIGMCVCGDWKKT